MMENSQQFLTKWLYILLDTAHCNSLQGTQEIEMGLSDRLANLASIAGKSWSRRWSNSTSSVCMYVCM